MQMQMQMQIQTQKQKQKQKQKQTGSRESPLTADQFGAAAAKVNVGRQASTLCGTTPAQRGPAGRGQ
jgi:hypothetical protein